ncbi:MAG: 50S ribosomal protein L22 [Deltaproteobacteria bacterium]|nr:50S ribosomal protein L22 [Deltaproteobacteria bacterium]
MEVKAQLRYARISPTKLRLVADMVRGKDIHMALSTLRFCSRRGAKVLTKLLNSAVANADHAGKIDIDTLFVKHISVDSGPSIRRFLPRAMGRATPIQHGTSHVKVVLAEK